MPFRKILDNLVKSCGALGAVMVAGDGEVVEASTQGRADLQVRPGRALELDLIGAHYAVVLDLCKSVAQMSAELGPVETLLVTCDGVRVAVTVLKEGYMVVVVMGRGDLSGRVVYESRCAVERIELEMG